MCIVCGPGGNRFLQATSARYGGSGPQRFAAEEILRETTPALDPLNREDLEGSADVILRGGPILTMRRPGEVAAAMALRSGRIQRLGDEDDVLPLRGRITRVIDLAGRAVAPGFINAHWHAPVSLLFDWLEWIDPASTEAILAAGRNGAGEWLVVQCAQKDTEAHAIARDALGRIERPAALIDEKCDIVFANATAHANPGAALALAAAPAHISLLLAPFAERPTVSRRPLTDRLRGAFEDLARSGFTTARFCGLGGLIGEGDVDLVRAALDGPNLLRIRGALGMQLLAGSANPTRNAGFGDDTFRVDTATAWIGDRESENAEFIRAARECHARGWHITLHAEGGAAIGAAVAGFVEMDRGPKGLTCADGLECSLRDGELAASLSAGRAFSFGLTDGEPADFDASAVVRACEAGDDPFSISVDRMVGVAGPLESLSIAARGSCAEVSLFDRLPVVTAWAGRRCGVDTILGVLDVGRYADLTFLDADPRAISASRNGRARCISTWVGGRETGAHFPGL